MNKVVRDYLLLALFVLGTGFGAATIMRVAIGVSAWDALTQNLAELTSIKVGTMGIILNILCLVGQFIIKKARVNPLVVFQIPMTLLLGTVVNIAYYDILNNLSLVAYWQKLLVFFLGQISIAASIGGIMTINRLVFPLEGICMSIEEKTSFSFVRIRQSVDVISVILALIIFFVFKTTPTIREGSIIGMLIFSPLVGLFMKFWKPIIR